MADHYISGPVVADLGTKDYLESLILQRKLVDMVKNGEIGDTLLFLDHPAVFTVGRGKKEENYAGVEVVETERGGDVTYHGPGQLVAYPIIDLERNGINDVRKLVHLVENVVISSIATFGFTGIVGDEPGIWVNGKKVASIGLAIRNKISFHGVAVNISGEVLSGFAKINPCGLSPETIGFVAINRNQLRDTMRMSFENQLHPFREVSSNFFKQFSL
ncbi:MAG: lipoyl(octanoyl) transferase LipB [Thermoplasmata archaeon]